MFKSINPTTGDVIAEYPEMTAANVQDVLEETHRAQQSWSNVSFEDRSRLMLKAGEVLLLNKVRYAQMMTDEMGKIATQGVSEVEKWRDH